MRKHASFNNVRLYFRQSARKLERHINSCLLAEPELTCITHHFGGTDPGADLLEERIVRVSECGGKIESVSVADCINGGNCILGKSGNTSDELDRRAGFESTTQCPFLVDHGINTTSHRIHHHHCAGVVTKRVDCNATHFGIFSADIVLRDVRLHFIAHGFINCHLSRDCRTTSSFCTTTSFQQCTAAAC